MNCGLGLSEVNINQIYLSLTRTFRYYRRDNSVEKSFAFLSDDEKYYETVVKDHEYLGKQGKFVPRVGKLRSVLDIPTEECMHDSFFVNFQDYYHKLLSRSRPNIEKGLILTPNYPCAIDILPSNRKKYRVITSTLPGSLKKVKKAKMSFAIRIYPVGLASLRLGWFLTTEESFKIEDIIEFLVKKRASIKIDDSTLSIGKLTKEYAERLISGLLKKEKPPLSWEDTYSIVDIVEATNLTLEQNYDDVFLPLLGLHRKPREEERTIDNLSRHGDVLLPGTRSIVMYFPSGDIVDRRKVRRWLRNIIELFSIQKFLISEIETMTISKTFGKFKKYWLRTLKRGVLPPTIKHLFSVWNYTNLHLRRYPLVKDVWRVRYQKILKILDKKDGIKKSNDQVIAQLEEIVKETGEASRRVGEWLKSLIAFVKKF